VTFTDIGAAVDHIDGNALRHAGWFAGGLRLSAPDSLPDFSDFPELPRLLPSDAGHFLAAWSTPYESSIKRVKLQRVGFDGGLDPAWPSAAVDAVARDSITNVTVLSDRQGGAYVLWYAHGLPKASHVLADGTFAPGTDGAGVALPSAGSAYVLPTTAWLNSPLRYVP